MITKIKLKKYHKFLKEKTEKYVDIERKTPELEQAMLEVLDCKIKFEDLFGEALKIK